MNYSTKLQIRFERLIYERCQKFNNAYSAWRTTLAKELGCTTSELDELIAFSIDTGFINVRENISVELNGYRPIVFSLCNNNN